MKWYKSETLMVETEDLRENSIYPSAKKALSFLAQNLHDFCMSHISPASPLPLRPLHD